MPTKFAPLLDLGESIQVVKDVYGVHAGDWFNIELLLEPLDTTKTSSNFPRRVSALQGFGLLQKENDTVQLTTLAVQIADPKAGEDAEAIIVAFKKVDVLEELLKRFPNAKLPADANQVKQILLKSLNVHRDGVETWYKFVIGSFRAIAGIASTATREVAVSANQEVAPKTGTIDLGGANDYQIIVPVDSGETIKMIIPKSATTKDLKKIKALLDALTEEEK